MYCPACGKQLPDNVYFCVHCGNQISKDPSPYAQQSAEANAAQATSGSNTAASDPDFQTPQMKIINPLESVTILEQSVASLKEKEGPDSEKVQETMMILAEMYEQTNRIDDAFRVYDELVEIRKRVYGDCSREMLELQALKAKKRYISSNGQEGIGALRKVIKKQKKFLGETDPDTVGSIMLLAEMYKLTGNHTSRLQVYQELYDIYLHSYGEKNEFTIDTLLEIAHSYRDDEKCGEAKRTYERVLELQRMIPDINEEKTRQTEEYIHDIKVSIRKFKVRRIYTRITMWICLAYTVTFVSILVYSFKHPDSWIDQKIAEITWSMDGQGGWIFVIMGIAAVIAGILGIIKLFRLVVYDLSASDYK